MDKLKIIRFYTLYNTFLIWGGQHALRTGWAYEVAKNTRSDGREVGLIFVYSIVGTTTMNVIAGTVDIQWHSGVLWVGGDAAEHN